MQRTGAISRILNTGFVMLLFCLFTMTVVMALLSGADAYQSMHRNMESQYTERTGLAYIEAKVHHYDKVGSVQVELFAGSPALALYEQSDGTKYKTLIYHHNGYIRELFFEDGLVLQPEDGQPVLMAQDLSFAWKQQNLMQIICTSAEGIQTEMLIYLHNGEEVALYV